MQKLIPMQDHEKYSKLLEKAKKGRDIILKQNIIDQDNVSKTMDYLIRH
jgi:hypothetical protein